MFWIIEIVFEPKFWKPVKIDYKKLQIIIKFELEKNLFLEHRQMKSVKILFLYLIFLITIMINLFQVVPACLQTFLARRFYSLGAPFSTWLPSISSPISSSPPQGGTSPPGTFLFSSWVHSFLLYSMYFTIIKHLPEHPPPLKTLPHS